MAPGAIGGNRGSNLLPTAYCLLPSAFSLLSSACGDVYSLSLN